MRKLLLALAIAVAIPTAAQTCPAHQRALVILGTFHMQPSGQDAVNRKADVRTPARQQELTDLVDKLARFAPTKIGIESARNSTVWNDRYQQWLDGKYTIGSNEIEQIGFRLAKKLSLAGLTPVDYPMWMNGLTPIERHEPKPRPQTSSSSSETADGIVNSVREQVAKDEEHLRTHTLAEHLAYLNEPRRAAMNHQWDVMSNLRPGDGVALYENTDLVTNWYKRNLRIFTNILDATTAEDRVLLIIGQGHAKILSDFAEEHPGVCLLPAGQFLR